MLEEFKTWLTINCDAEKTAFNYFQEIKKLVNKYGEPIDQNKINQHFLFLKEYRAKNTFNQFVNALKKYQTFTKQTFEIPKQRNCDQRINQYISEEELIGDILPVFSLIFENSYQKKELILKFLFYTGLRAEELLNLRREDFNWEEETIHIKNTKTNKDRKVPFIKTKLIEEVKNYFATEPETRNAFNISKSSLNNMFIIIKQNLRFRIPINPKLMRHSCGVHLLNKEHYTLPAVSKWLGHTKLETTGIYVTPIFDDILKYAKTKRKTLDRS